MQQDFQATEIMASPPPAVNVPQFRPEVADHQARSQQFGDNLNFNVPSFRVMTIVAMVTVSLTIFGVTNFTYARKVQVNGVITPEHGVRAIVSAQNGKVIKSLVKEDQVVHAGDVLFIVDGSIISATGGDVGEKVRLSLDETRRSLIASRERIVVQGQDNERAIQHRINSLSQSKDDELIGRQVHIVKMTEQDLERHKALLGQGFISPLAYEAKSSELSKQQLTLGTLQAERDSHQRDLMQAQADLKQAIATTKLNVDTNERELLALKRPEADNESRQSIAIKAPQDGTITSIGVEEGYPVTANQPLAKLVPPDRLLVELYVPSRSAGFVKKGTKVQLAYDAWAYQKYGLQDAEVIEVTKTATSFQEMTLPGAQQAAQGEAGFRVRILPMKQTFAVDSEEKPLKSGMSVEARLVQDERTLVRWLFENLWTIRANM